MKRFLAMTALTLALCGCAAFVNSPRVDLSGIRITGLDRSGLQLELLLAVANDNGSDLVLTGGRYDLQVQSLPVTRGELTRRTVFPARTVTDVTVPVQLPYAAVIDLLQRRIDPERVPYTLTADLRVESLLGDITVPVAKNGTFAVPEKFRASSLLHLLNGLVPK